MSDKTMKTKFEFGRRVGENIYYTGFTIAANSKDEALSEYMMRSKDESQDGLVINKIED